MFEVGIISIIVLAVGYWVTLWLMGRHDDVLHGDFVHMDDGGEVPALPEPVFPARPPFPPKPVIRRHVAAPTALTPPSVMPVKPKPAPVAALPVQSSPEGSDTLQTLLASIKRDLKDASQL